MRPTAERIRKVLSYDPLTGVFLWKFRIDAARNWNTKNAGKVAGSCHNGGYLHISIDGVKYLAHVLAWVYVHGQWPSSNVDHRNLVKRDNRLENLRLASFAESSANISVRKTSNSGHRGVWWRADRARWVACIHKDNRAYWIGSFKEKREAAEAYAVKARDLYGEFCPNYLQAAA